MMDGTELVSLEEAAELLGITQGKARDYLGAGKLDGYKVRVSHSPRPGCHSEWFYVSWGSIEAYKVRRERALGKMGGANRCPDCDLPGTGGKLCSLCTAAREGKRYDFLRGLEPVVTSAFCGLCITEGISFLHCHGGK